MYYRQTRFCRLCGREYIPRRDIGRDGFCCSHHRIILHRFTKDLKRNGRLTSKACVTDALRRGR